MTKVLKFRLRSLLEAASLIMKGGIVAYPTDTVYGLGCDPFNPEAVRRLVRAKNRKKGRLPILVDSVGRAAEFGKFDLASLRLARHFWPGPLTLVVRVRIGLPSVVTGSTDDVGLRIPRHHVAIGLVRACGGAIVGTSANVSGSVPLRTAREVAEELGDDLDLILDAGRSWSGIESTVVSIDNGALSVLREKSISKERIYRVLRSIRNQPS